ncbi:MAG: hypothetical protein ABJM86_11730 [Hyphomicrobiales bacterium]
MPMANREALVAATLLVAQAHLVVVRANNAQQAAGFQQKIF